MPTLGVGNTSQEATPRVGWVKREAWLVYHVRQEHSDNGYRHLHLVKITDRLTIDKFTKDRVFVSISDVGDCCIRLQYT